MKAEELREKLRDVIAFPVTPFTFDHSQDVAGLKRNDTGEMYSLSTMEHLAVTNAIVERAGVARYWEMVLRARWR